MTLTVVLLRIQVFWDVTQFCSVCSSQHHVPINAGNHSANDRAPYPTRPEPQSFHYTDFFLPNNNFHIQKFYLITLNIFFPSQMPKLGTSRVQYVWTQVI
jgi:hypothetical protein